MKFKCTIECLREGRWQARTTGSTVGEVQAEGPDRQAALERLRAEIRYRLELCPCSGVGEDFVELEIR